MNLFFETSRQSVVFLCFLPLGFALALLLSLLKRAGRFRVLADVAVMLAAALAFVATIVLARDDGLRLYQLLALLVGAALYVFGLGRLAGLTASWLKKLWRRKQIDCESARNMYEP